MTTKVFNQAVKRNKRKFPADFMFQLTLEEYENLRSQFLTGSQKHRNPRYLLSAPRKTSRVWKKIIFGENGVCNPVPEILRS